MPTRSFVHRHRVTYAECTLGNHVYYARYLDLLEAARGEFFRAAGMPLLELQERDTIFPVIECRVSYKAPARYDDVLEISVRVSEVRGARLVFAYSIQDVSSHRLVLQAETVHVCTSADEKPKRVPKELLTALAPFINDSGDLSPA